MTERGNPAPGGGAACACCERGEFVGEPVPGCRSCGHFIEVHGLPCWIRDLSTPTVEV